MYLVISPDGVPFILLGWDYQPIAKGKPGIFPGEEPWYVDKLLHCIDKQEKEQCSKSNEEKVVSPTFNQHQVL